MVDPTAAVSWHVADGTATSQTRQLSKIIEVAAYWIRMWQPFVRAAIGRTVRFIIAPGDAPIDLRCDDKEIEARIWLPDSLIRGSARTAAFAMLDRAMAALEISAERWPTEPPQTLPGTDDRPRDGSVLSVAALQPEEVLLIAGVPGRDDGGEARFHELDDYVLARVEDAGVGVVDDLTVDDPFIEWIIVLDDQ